MARSTSRAGGSVLDDSQAYDVYTQIARLVRVSSPGSALSGLRVRRVYAAGASQSASFLIRYYNSIQPTTKAFDGFMVTIGGGAPRLDQPTPLMKVYTENEVVRFIVRQRVADTASVRSWEITGGAHVGPALLSPDATGQAVLGGLLGREIGPVSPVSARQCVRPHPSAVENWVVHRAAYAALDRWVTKRVVPPASDRIQTVEPLNTDGSATLTRDQHGIAVGGIRLPRVAVPTSLNSGENRPANEAPENGFCGLYGTHQSFDAAVLETLYPTQDAYTRKVKSAVDRLVSRGFVLRDDAALLIANAAGDFKEVGR